MRKTLITLFVLLAVTLDSAAQSLPDTPKPKRDRRTFIVGVVALAGAQAADALSTRKLLDRGGWENNLVLGRHPSNRRLVGYAAATFAGTSTAFYFTEHNRRAWVRWTGRALVGLAIEEHARLAACNSRIKVHGPVQNCHALLPF